MKLVCKENHWYIKDNQVSLETPEGNQVDMIKAIEATIRLHIYEQICALDLTTNRAQIVKNGIDKTALTVQDLCAQIALGEKK